ncbi:hypothetical protein [Shouchella lonarensis]|uniref:Uncharacterized protein n=1 Tax=Shouchella lonarensis TaxID=1464122 RepID=A0A1G6IL08_9BACI|nr:hypothetical protein [Shouchella lonarensis]SDC06446.1 hypothetical protein SAMN05421737_10580 [Shouchella lonarensis]
MDRTEQMGQLTEEEKMRIELSNKARITEQLAARLGQREIELAESQTRCETFAAAFEEVQKELQAWKDGSKGGDCRN